MKQSILLRKVRVMLRSIQSYKIKGGNDMDYVVEKMESMKIIGYDRTFSFDSAYEEIPKFWNEFSQKCMNGKNTDEVKKVIEDCDIGEFGVSILDENSKTEFYYVIGGRYNGCAVPNGMKVFDIPALEWAKFTCTGPLPGALQTINTRIFNEWLPENTEYEIASYINIEWYSKGDCNATDYKSGIWVPVKKNNI